MVKHRCLETQIVEDKVFNDGVFAMYRNLWLKSEKTQIKLTIRKKNIYTSVEVELVRNNFIRSSSSLIK